VSINHFISLVASCVMHGGMIVILATVPVLSSVEYLPDAEKQSSINTTLLDKKVQTETLDLEIMEVKSDLKEYSPSRDLSFTELTALTISEPDYGPLIQIPPFHLKVLELTETYAVALPQKVIPVNHQVPTLRSAIPPLRSEALEPDPFPQPPNRNLAGKTEASLHEDLAEPPAQSVVAADMEPATFVHNPKPHYPELAIRRRMEGLVILQITISKSGTVSLLSIVKSSGFAILDKAAFDAVSQWQFTAASQGGKPVEWKVRLPVRFRLP